MTVVCYTLGMSRRTGHYVRRERLPGRYQRADDAVVLQQIHAATNSRATNGYRAVDRLRGRTLEERESRDELAAAGFEGVDFEPTRVYRVEDAREFLMGAGLDVDAIAP